MFYKGIWYARESGYFTEAREMVLKSRECILKIYGEESEESLASSAMLASIYRLDGMWEKAE